MKKSSNKTRHILILATLLGLLICADVAYRQIVFSQPSRDSGLAATPSIESLTQRANLFLEDSDWQRATEYFNRVLDIDPEFAPAYIGLLCAELNVSNEKLLGDLAVPISEQRNFQRAIRFADATYKTKIEYYDIKIRERIQKEDGNRRAGDRMVLDINGVEYSFRWCPPGTFMMGSPVEEEGRAGDETLHQVTLSLGYWMLETEVTGEMWRGVMGNSSSIGREQKLPVSMVNWSACQVYIGRLNDMGIAPSGYKFSLPTEAQWEYACRAGTTTAYYFGDTLASQQAHVAGTANGVRTREVGSFPANAWGLHDMHGSVWEWCLDWYGIYPNGNVTDPQGASTGSARVLRGGTYWSSDETSCRSAKRNGDSSSMRNNYFARIGFRIALVRD